MGLVRGLPAPGRRPPRPFFTSAMIDFRKSFPSLDFTPGDFPESGNSRTIRERLSDYPSVSRQPPRREPRGTAPAPTAMELLLGALHFLRARISRSAWMRGDRK